LQFDNQCWYITEDSLILTYNSDLGWWRIDDPQHPDYFDKAVASTSQAPPTEQFVAGALHHVATLGGTHPLSPETGLSPVTDTIKEATIQGKDIPVNIPPVIIHTPAIIAAAAVPAPAFIAPAPIPAPALMAAPAAAANRALRGNPPPIFDGDRIKSNDFLLAFCIYKFTNRAHEVMTNPATRTTTALSYIAGLLVEAWKEEQLMLLEHNIANNVAEGDEVHWTTFITNFQNAFTNTNKKNDAYRELQALKHKDDLDMFITRFKQLVTAAELDINSHGVLEIFKQGLKQALIQNVLTIPDYDPNTTYTFTEMEKHVCDLHLCWINSQAYRR